MTALTTQLTPYGDEELTSFLVRTANANGISSRALSNLIRTAAKTSLLNSKTNLAGTSPPPALLATIRELTGLPTPSVAAMTMQRYRSSSNPALTCFPWQPPIGTALCPQCVNVTDPHWQLSWRLPMSFACTIHRIALHERCRHCGKRFHTNRSPALPPDLIYCDSHIAGFGTVTVTCRHDLTELPQHRLSDAQLQTAQRLQHVCRGNHVNQLGRTVPGLVYLDNLYAIALLLIHISLVAHQQDLYPWGTYYSTTRPRTRHITLSHTALPPPRIRAELLTAADTLLQRTSPTTAAALLYDHLAHVPRRPEGITSWALSRTRPTAISIDLIHQALAPRRSFGRYLGQLSPAPTCTSTMIPQAIPPQIYQLHFADALATSDTLGRQYISLCLARRISGVTTWSAAGTALASSGTRAQQIALSCSPAIQVSRDELIHRIQLAEQLLIPTINYRAIEEQVRRYHTDLAWMENWRRHRCPSCHRRTSYANIAEYLWRTWAHGTPCTQSWSASWSAGRRHQYVKWAARLAADHTP